MTSAKLHQHSQRNVIASSQSGRRSEGLLATTPQITTNSLDTIDCPMCAETITAKAKICRYCGYKLQEEKENLLASFAADPSVAEVFLTKDLIARYRTSVDYDSEQISDQMIVDLLLCFSRHIKVHPGIGYRDIADLVKAELDCPKKIINDIVREGFTFVRGIGLDRTQSRLGNSRH